MKFTQEEIYTLLTALERLQSACGSDSEYQIVFLERAGVLQERFEALSDGSVTFQELLKRGSV